MEPNNKQQVTEIIKNAKNVVITTVKNPGVDEITSALGLSLMLKKLEKHVNLIVSGQLPKGVDFVVGNEKFESSADGTRDFVIEFDRNKVDKLRYKKEEDVVKIFLTPYRSAISKDDFRFNQGDYNVDAIVVIGATKKDEVDTAITSKSRLMHDANVVGIATKDNSSLPGIGWSEPTASSTAEMLVSISEALQGNLLDAKSSTALLTGIIAATDHFTNKATTPKVMTMAAQLMAAGADQQMIMAELKKSAIVHEEKPKPKKKAAPKAKPVTTEPKPAPAPEPEQPSKDTDMTLELESNLQKEFDVHDEAQQTAPVAETKVEKPQPPKNVELPTPAPAPIVEEEPEVEAPAPEAEPESTDAFEDDEIHIDEHGNIGAKPAPAPISAPEPVTEPETTPSPSPKAEPEIVETPVEKPVETPHEHTEKKHKLVSAPEVERGDEGESTILSHSSKPLNETASPDMESTALEETPRIQSHQKVVPVPQPNTDQSQPPTVPVAPTFSTPAPQFAPKAAPAPQAPQAPVTPPVAPAANPTESSVNDALADLDAARAAVENAVDSAPFDPSNQPLQSMGAQPLDGNQNLL